jgi:tetratricopeptide (TPR) repeat protein
MAAITRIYTCDLAGALAEGSDAVAAADRVGHQRAAIIAHHSVYFCAMARGELALARDHAERALEGSRRLGARRFESESLAFLGDTRWQGGDRAEGIALLREALAISRESGIAYMGPMLLGTLARITDDPEERRAALAEAEALLAAGSVSHNFLWFYYEAIETALNTGEWAAAERYAAALESYTRPEPLPWADFHVARGRALAAFGGGARDDDTIAGLRRLRDAAERAGLQLMLPALQAALADAAATAPVVVGSGQ